MPLLSVVIPTYNEAANIGPLLADLRSALSGVDAEFVVVDDDSKDGTAEKARAAGGRVIVRTDERGLGTAVVRGIEVAMGTYVAVMDADFQHPPQVIPRLLEKAQKTGADLVVGSRYAHGGSQGEFPTHRRFMSWTAASLARLALPAVRRGHVTDPMSGLFLVRKACVPLASLRPHGYKILLEILGRSRLGRVDEVGYLFQDRRAGQSKLGTRVLGQYLTHLALLAKDQKDNRRFGKFVVVGACGGIVQLGVFYLLLRGLGA
ncbi:MAG: polyprenol monophosphomannose synthase, partial [Thermoplasmatota archaeon]